MDASAVARGGRRRAAFIAAGLVLLAACGGEDRARGVATEPVVDAGTPRELAVIVEDLMPRLERLSGLDRVETLRLRRQSRAAARAYVEQRLEQELPADEREALRRTYVVLGLLPDTLDLTALLLDLYTEQVLGYYDPTTRTLFVVAGADAASLRPVIAHELVHALQDQHTNLDSLIARERGNDRQTAAHAAMEGHAMVVMFATLAEQASGQRVDPAALPNPADELGPALEAQNEEFPVFRRAPPVIRETLLFPYLRGADFIHQLWNAHAPLPRYPAPIDSLLPQSTAQVMQPLERFIRQRVDPVGLRFDSVPAGWRVLRENDFGQLETGIFLGHHLGDAARRAADGWRGDRYLLLADDRGRDALYWVSVWDSSEAADRFAAAARRAASGRHGRSVLVRREALGGVAAVVVLDTAADTDPSALPRIPVTRLSLH